LKKTFILISVLVNLIPLSLTAQKAAVVFGTIRDMDNQVIQNANIALGNLPGGTTSSKAGTFELQVPSGIPVTLIVTCMGYEQNTFKVTLDPGKRKELNVTLYKSTTELESVEVRDQQMKTNTFNRINPQTLNLIPTINASVEDLIKTLPGVSSHNEMSSQYSVRGGNFDENLVFINDIEVYRPSLIRSGQQEGLSVVNPDMVSSISFSAGGFEAKYGDKMSSVLDIRYKKPVSFAGSFELSLLGASAHVEGTAGKKFSFILGGRYKTNSYFLKGLDTKGSYKPRFFDVQALVNYEVSKKWEVSLLGIASDNLYKLIPETRETSFGSLNEIYKFTVFFDGKELDQFQNWLGAATVTYKPVKNIRLKLSSSAYQTYETETYDILGQYWLGLVESPGGESTGQVEQSLGVGSYLDHARNYLDGTVFNVEHRGYYDMPDNQLQWGAKYQYEYFSSRNNQWELQDSAGYSLPRPLDSIGYIVPHPTDSLLLTHVIKSSGSLGINRLNGFLQDTWTFRLDKTDITLTAGIRCMYSDNNDQFLLNPRVNLSFNPHWKHSTMFRLSGGYYSQPPTLRELTDLKGNIIPDLKAQTAIQAVVGSDYYFKAWGRPFKFTAEAYYKYLQDIIPYEIDNLQIRYYGTNDAYGYATGVDFRVNGEFVKGAESWASLSIMKTEENIDGVWIPRPTDQRVNLSIFFQDYIPHYPSWRMNLTLFYGTGLPFGAPDSPRKDQTLRMPPYRRVDIGLSKQLISEKTKFSNKNPLRVFQSLWLSLEVFNLLQFNNTVSYLWITDVNGRSHPVPNYLTPRQFNLKLIAAF
jgi:hypothetical protein